jgi:hypothetical protein
MIRDYSTGKTKFVKMKISSPDGRFNQDFIEGGLTKKTALFEAKSYDKMMIIQIFDSNN